MKEMNIMKMSTSKLLTLWQKHHNMIVILGFIILGLSIILAESGGFQKHGGGKKETSEGNPSLISENQRDPEDESPDTIIPPGFVLVPLDLINQESLSSLMGDFGLVDLYSAPGIGSDSLNLRGVIRQRPIARRVKLLRAPLNPHQFAVLVPEKEMSRMMATPGPFFAVLQNRKLAEEHWEWGGREKKERAPAPTTKVSRVEYYNNSTEKKRPKNKNQGVRNQTTQNQFIQDRTIPREAEEMERTVENSRDRDTEESE